MRDAVAHAIGVAPNLAEAQASLGLMKFWLDWDSGASETAFRNAIRLDPGYGLAHRTLGVLLSQTKRHDAALSAMQTARELDPLDFVHLVCPAFLRCREARWKRCWRRG